MYLSRFEIQLPPMQLAGEWVVTCPAQMQALLMECSCHICGASCIWRELHNWVPSFRGCIGKPACSVRPRAAHQRRLQHTETMKGRRLLASLLILSYGSASRTVFSVHDDVLAFPQASRSCL